MKLQLHKTQALIANDGTVLEHRQKINEAIRFVMADTSQELNLQTVAASVYVSPFHFHRMFSLYVGESLGEHIRKQRMRKAALLIASGIPVVDIAKESGYSNISAFGKAFRHVFGISPTHLKDPYSLHWTHQQSAYKKNNDAVFYPVRIVEKPSFTVFFIRNNFSQEGIVFENINRAFAGSFTIWENILRERNVQKDVCKRIGFIKNAVGLNGPVSCCESGIIINNQGLLDNANSNTGIKKREVHKGRWAVITHKGPYSTLWQTWNWIFSQWIFVSGHSLRKEDPFEVYLNDQRTTAAENLLTEIYVPVL